MGHGRVIAGSCLAFAATVFVLFALLDKGMVPKRFLLYIGLSAAADLGWYPPKQSWINNLSEVINGTGLHGFVFDSSVLPLGTPYGTYNWCNMPHVRREEYAIPDAEYKLEYVEVIHRHHKRTPYAANTFPHETYSWDCSDAGLFYYGQPLHPTGNASSPTYWSVYTSETNPFAASGFNGTCAFPQLTRGGLDDSWQHGQDLYGVYHDLLAFLTSSPNPDIVSYRVTNNVITSQVASMVISGMYPSSNSANTPLHIQPPSIDSLEPSYACPAASTLYSSYSVGSSASNWTAHLTLTAPLFSQLDAISGINPSSTDWHKSYDHYYDNLSSRQCHHKPLPCSSTNTNTDTNTNGTTNPNITTPPCITQSMANTIYRLGQYEYSFIHRDSPSSLRAAIGSIGVWIAELAANIRASISGASTIIYRHNVAHDGSVSSVLSILQVDSMVWVGMGAELVFEVYSKKGGEQVGKKRYLRILWGGQVLTSSNPSLGTVDMIDLDVFLGYVDGLVGARAEKVVELCQS